MDTQKRVTELALDIFSPPQKVKEEITKLHQLGEKWYLHEGLQGIKRIKFFFDYLLEHLLGQPVDCPPWIKKDSNGHPSYLTNIIGWSEDHPKVALTLLRNHELFQDILTDDKCLKAMETITAPSEALMSPEIVNMILGEAKELATDSLKVTIGTVPMFSNGPNGISILSVHRDARAHAKYGTRHLVERLGEAIAFNSPGIKVSEVNSNMLEIFQDPIGSEELGRVVFLPEKAGKLRVIAQGDYISQSVLKPIHDTINGILRRIKGDYTFDQEAGKQWMIRQTANRDWLASYDLSSATDRLPVKLQADIISIVMPGELGDTWKSVIVDRDFRYNLPSGETGTVRYSVGQPMGMYSSFPAFALMHHCVVRASWKLAHKGAPLPKYQFYGIIGDDIVISDKKTGEMYCMVMQNIGAVINLSKSRLSKTAGVTIGEFAKCWSTNGTDITPYSLRAIRSALQSWSHVPELFHRIWKVTGVTPKAKKLKFILRKYWPKEANILIRLIPVPHELGGFGKPDHHPLRETIKGEGGNALRIFLAQKAYVAYRKVINISSDALDNEFTDVTDRSKLRVAMQPLLKLIRDRGAEVGLSHVMTSRKSFIRWCLDEDIPISSLLEWIDTMIRDLPVSLRQTLPNSSIGWVNALKDDKKLSSRPLDSDMSLDMAIQKVTSYTYKTRINQPWISK